MSFNKYKILISFCNPVDCNENLLILDIKTGNKKYLLNSEQGVTGLAQDNKYLYSLSQDGYINIFQKSYLYQIFLSQKLENLISPHSIFVDGNFIYIVSTGNDNILKYKFDEIKKEINFIDYVWKPEISKGESDTHHINSIFKYNSDIYISAFGERGEKWSSAKNGYILNINKNKKEIEHIYHPHSVFISNKNFYYCESATRSVKKNEIKIIQLLSGYPRGLCINKNKLYLGTSTGRKRSHSTGEINNPVDGGILEDDCRLLMYKKVLFTRKYKLIKEFNFLPKHKEIYDIMIIN
jgi:hypothetical protein